MICFIYKFPESFQDGWRQGWKGKPVPHQGSHSSKHKVLQWLAHSDFHGLGLPKANKIAPVLLLGNSRSEIWTQEIWTKVHALPRCCPVHLPTRNFWQTYVLSLQGWLVFCTWILRKGCIIDGCHGLIFTVLLSASLIPIPPDVCLKYLHQDAHLPQKPSHCFIALVNNIYSLYSLMFA